MQITGSESPSKKLEACTSCNSTRFSIICERWDGSKVTKCLDCQLEFVNPLPSEEYLEELYNQDMLAGGAKTSSSLLRDYIQERNDRKKSYNKLYQARLQLIEKFYPKQGKLLDIGCAAGFFLEAAKSRGWETHGLDVMPDYIQFAREELHQENVHCNTLEKMEYSKGSFDVVTLWDLIEHVKVPLATLKEINRVLRPGGLVVIWTPNARNAAYLKEAWIGYHIRLHLNFLSSASLSNLLDGSGFQTIHHSTNKAKKGFFSNFKSEGYQKPLQPSSGLNKVWKGVKRDLKNAVNPINYLSPLLDQLGYGFNLFLIAKKKAE